MDKRGASRGKSSRGETCRGRSSRGGAANEDRTRPTASERRRRTGKTIYEERGDDVQPEENVMEDDNNDSDGPFPGGPTDMSLLRSFNSHIAASIWKNEVLEIIHNDLYNLKFYNYIVCNIVIDLWLVFENRNVSP